MNYISKTRTTVLLAVLLFGLLSISCNRRSLEGMLIVTEAPGDLQDRNVRSGDAWRYMIGARLVAVDPDKPSSVKILGGDFYSACSPVISSDGKRMLFAAQQKQDDVWQIWEMNLGNQKYRKITALEEDCIDPVILPNGRVIFSKQIPVYSLHSGHALFSCNADGSDLKQITFHPNTNFASAVLKDGRLLTVTRQLFPKQANSMLMVLRPDGTKADLFYNNESGAALLSRASEAADGKIYFIEADSANLRHGNLVSIRYNRPLHSKTNLSEGITGDFVSVLPLTPEKLCVSYRSSDTESYALFEFDPADKAIGKKIYSNPGYQVTDAVLVHAQERPKKLPSEVDLGVKTGLLMCQDINVTGTSVSGNYTFDRKAVKIEVLGIDSTLGIVDVEKDGSFYLKVAADMPFQIRTLDEKGIVVQEACDWIWIRPNERRGCIGCHEDTEMVPENQVPLAVKKSPVMIPLQDKTLSEKQVELE